MNRSPLLIINGTLVSPEKNIREDLVIDQGKIISRGILDPAEYPGYTVLDADGKIIFPSAIDPHVHLALPTPAGPSSDDFITGSKAAIAGGTTCIMDFVTPHRGQSLIEALHARKAEAASSLVDHRLHLGISGWHENIETEIRSCIEEEGIRSFKTYLAYRESIGISLSELERVMRIVGPAGGLVMVHCEDGEMISGLQQEYLSKGLTDARYHALSRPPETEIRAIQRVIELSAKTGCPAYIVHISTGEGAEAVRQAKKSGLKIFAETCIQYLMLNDSVYDETLDNMKVLPYVISPPIRAEKDRQQLWQGLADGTFDTVATDHCPFNLHGQKDKGINDFTKIPNGAGGIEFRLPLLYTYGVLTKKITINQFVSLVSSRPAEIFGLSGRKGRLDPGFDADIVIWDPDFEGFISAKNQFQRCDSNIYEGMKIRGRAETVISNGEIALQKGVLKAGKHKGKFLEL